MLTERERLYCSEIAHRIQRVRDFLNANHLTEPPHPAHWHAFLSELRHIQGNIHNAGSFIATLLAKQYLCSRFPVDFDAAEKAQGAMGMDIDVQTEDGQRIVGEIKTTVPYLATDFGAQQVASLKKDFVKLSASNAAHKFLFVTDSHAFSVLRKDKYMHQTPGVCIVQLITGEEYDPATRSVIRRPRDDAFA